MIDLMAEGRKVAEKLYSRYQQPSFKKSIAATCASADPQYPLASLILKSIPIKVRQIVDNINLGQAIIHQGNPLEELELTFENRTWVSKQIAYKWQGQRLELLEQYRYHYLKAAASIPESLSHKKANAGTFAANTWLSELLSKLF